MKWTWSQLWVFNEPKLSAILRLQVGLHLYSEDKYTPPTHIQESFKLSSIVCTSPPAASNISLVGGARHMQSNEQCGGKNFHVNFGTNGGCIISNSGIYSYYWLFYSS